MTHHPIHAILTDISHTILWVGYLDPSVTPTGLASVFRRRIQAADSAFPGLPKTLVFLVLPHGSDFPGFAGTIEG